MRTPEHQPKQGKPALNFKHPEGRRLLDELIARADILVENFRPGTLDELGLGYEALRAKHPG